MFAQQRPGVIELLSRCNLGWFLDRRFLADDRMTELTILAQYLAFTADMVALVTTKTTRIEGVADVVGVGAPIDFHFGKDIGLVNLLNLADGFINRLPSLFVNLWILF